MPGLHSPQGRRARPGERGARLILAGRRAAIKRGHRMRGAGDARGVDPRVGALTWTAVVEVDVAVDVEPIVDLHLDHRSRWFDEDRRPPEGLRTRSRSTRRPRCRSGRGLATT